MSASLTRTSPEQSGFLCLGPNRRQLECYATSTYEAQRLAQAHWNLPNKKRPEISVHLCERANGVPYIHTATN